MSFNILVVDDTKFMRKMLTDILKQFGYEVVGEAENGKQAVQRFSELRPDVVLMDITMPEMDGIEAMKEIRRIDPQAVVLICSAMSQQDLISDALKAGANGYLMKPFKPNRVNEIIRKYGYRRVDHEPLTIMDEREEDDSAIPQPVPQAQPPQLQEVQSESEALVLEESAAVAAEPLQAAEADVAVEVAAEVEAEPEQDLERYVAELAAALMEERAVEEPEERLQEEAPSSLVAEELEEEAEEASFLQTEAAVILEADSQQTELPEQQVEQEESANRQADELEPAELEATATDELALPHSIMEDRDEEQAVAEEEISLDELNDLTMLMAEQEAQAEQQEAVADSLPPMLAAEEPSVSNRAANETAEYRQRGAKYGDNGKIINLFRGNGPVKNFTSSYMCNWNEELNGDASQFLVVCTEAENKVSIEMTNNNQKQVVNLSIDGFNQLAQWLNIQLGNVPLPARELSKRENY